MKRELLISMAICLPVVSMGITTDVYEGDGASGIQTTINACSSGDTVMVHNGTYYAKSIGTNGITMKNGVILKSADGATNCILSGCNNAGCGSHSYHVIYCSGVGNGTVIDGFTITQGNATGTGFNRYGGGIHIVNNSSPTVKDNIIKDNSATNSLNAYGGGIYISGGAPTITGNTIEDNSADVGPTCNNWRHAYGGGIYIFNSSPTLTGNTIKGNSAIGVSGCGHQYAYGGGLYILLNDPNFTPILTNNIIENNSTTGGDNNGHHYAYGGGVYILISTADANSAPTFTGNTIKDNSADGGSGCGHHYGHGGGVYILVTADLNPCPIFTGNLIKNNSASDEGGGLYLGKSCTAFKDNIITNNTAYYGGGLLLWGTAADPSACTLRKCVISCNKGDYGGAIYNGASSSPDIDSCFIVDNGNTGDAKSGCVYTTSSGISICSSHVYYNTYQTGGDEDAEIENTSAEIQIEKNYWWVTNGEDISTLIEGTNDHNPWLANMISSGIGVPGEPTTVEWVQNWNKSYSGTVDSLKSGDTLYLQVQGTDRNTNLREATVVILKSSVYPDGIAVALIETGTNTGIYKGEAYVKTTTSKADNIREDDIYQTIRVRDGCDTIMVIANMDATKEFGITVGCLASYAVELVSFDAIGHDNYIQLTWMTECEINNSHWVIERSLKDSNYIERATLLAEGCGPNTYIWIDTLIVNGMTYWYRLGDVDESGKIEWHGPMQVKARGKIYKFGLHQSYPNPFINSTTVRYSIPGKAGEFGIPLPVELKVYDITGKLVRTLVNEKKKPGSYVVPWDGSGSSRNKVSNGIYFYRLQVGKYIATKKALLLK